MTNAGLKPQSVFLVTTGCYSDRLVAAVFSTRENAELWVREFTSCELDGSADIEEMVLDERQDGRAMDIYRVLLRADGSLSERSVDRGVTTAEESTGAGRNDWDGRFYGESTRSAEHALKLAAEFRQAWLRENPK